MKRSIVALLIVFVAIIGMHVYIMIEIPKIAQLTKKVSDLENQLNNLNALQQNQDKQVNMTIAGVNVLYARVATLDKGATSMTMTSGFAPTNYLSELNHFKNMNAAEQQTYLNMSKEAKLAKYGKV